MQINPAEFNKDIYIAKHWTNHQAYSFAFSELFMRRHQQDKSMIIGNNQRSMFLPILNKLIDELTTDCRLLDVGGGSGDMVELALQKLTQATIDIGEPNPLMLAQYREKLQYHHNLSCGAVFEQPIQYYYDKHPDGLLSNVYDSILAIHMIYHLTDFRQNDIQPHQDLINFMTFLFDKLRPGGKMFLVYTDQTHTFIGKATSHYYNQHCDMMASHLTQIIDARDELLTNMAVLPHLTAHSKHQANITIHHLDSHIHANTLAELAMISLIGELGHIDGDLFEFDKFEHSLEFLKRHGRQVGLTRCTDPDKLAMWQVNQPQIVLELSKSI